MRGVSYALTNGFAAFAAACVCTVLAASSAHASDAEDFVQNYVQHGLDILSDKTLSAADKHKTFEALLDPITDMHRVALYTLGPTAKTAPADQLDAFTKAFHDLEIAAYEHELKRGQKLKIENAIDRAPGDTIVQAYILDANGNRTVLSQEIDFRVEKAGDKFVLIDVCIVGVWIAVQQHEQYTSWLALRGNTLPKLTQKIVNRAIRTQRSTEHM